MWKYAKRCLGCDKPIVSTRPDILRCSPCDSIHRNAGKLLPVPPPTAAKQKAKAEYPFYCKRCGVFVTRHRSSKRNSKAHRLGKCSKKCNGIQKDRGGYPLKNKPVKKTTPKIAFYDSPQWQALRYKVLRAHGRVCALCRNTQGEMHVDHIKPRSKYPHLELVESNLQILCKDCNMGKSNKYEDDWRDT